MIEVHLLHGPLRPLLPAIPDAQVLTTGAIGFLDAAAEDRERWSRGFRQLLDGLDAPLQVVIDVAVGDGDPELPPTVLPDLGAPSLVERRALDLAHAAALRALPTAQRRVVSLVTTPAAAQLVERGLQLLGVPQVTRSIATAAAAGSPRGVESPTGWWDETGLYRTWFLDRFPGHDLDPGWLLRLVPAGLEISLAWHAERLATAGVVEYLQRQLIRLRARQLDRGDVGEPEVEGALPAVERLQRQLMARQEQAFHVSLYLTVRTHGPRQLAHAATQIEAAARSALTVLHPATFRQREARLATLPVGLDPLRRRRVLDSSSLTTLAPWWDGDLQQPGGLLCGVSRATGQPVLLDPFDDSRHQNANIGVYGHSGAGKTYLLSTLALGALDLGIQVLIVDPEHEYGGLADLLGGHHVRLALGSDVSINVLDLDQGVIDPDGLAPRIADAVDLCDVVCGGLDPAERAEVEGAVRQVVAHHPAPLLGDVAACLDATSRPARVLQRWVTGSLGRLFSRPTNVDLSAPLIVFGMRELRPELVGPVHFLLAQALWGRIRRRDRRRLLVVDELGLLFEDPTMRGFVVSLARRIRKYDGSLCFATQNPGDLLSSEAGAVVATNPAIQFFGSLRPGEAVRVQRHFELSERQRAGLEQAARGEFLLAAGTDRIPLRVTAPPWQAALLNQLRGSPAPARASPRAEASVGDS